MDNLFGGIMIGLIGFSLFCFGWAFAHSTVSTECQKLQSFYIGEKVFECKLKDKQ
jgi:hypothetical protein